MSTDEDDELARLRRRAYSPTADIASDPQALQRLTELEARALANEHAVAIEDEPAPAHERPSADEIPDAVPLPPRFTSPRVRRSTVVLLVAAALVVATLATALTLVQRVQTDPLQTGATQVARLAPDPDYEVPRSLTQGVTGRVTAYAEFEGFRVITQPSYRDSETTARCMTIWQPALLELADDGFSYSGEDLLQSVCRAGVFPASSTMLLREDSPERTQTDLPAGAALQFVYDEQNDEVVVFRG